MAHSVVGPVQQALFDALFKQGPDELRFMRVCITFGHDLSPRAWSVLEIAPLWPRLATWPP